MRLSKARIRNYRSVRDTGEFEVENGKTILVGPNEAGKTVILQALQKLNAPDEIEGFEPLRDYPRSEYNDITRGVVDPSDVTVVEGHFTLEEADLEGLEKGYETCNYVFGRRLDNTSWHRIVGGPGLPTYGELSKDLKRLCAHIDKHKEDENPAPSAQLDAVVAGWGDDARIKGERAEKLKEWLEGALPLIDEDNETEEKRYDRLLRACSVHKEQAAALRHLRSRLPVFVLFNNYFRVRPRIHLEHLAQRVQSGVLDDKQYDYGNLCLLKLLGFTPKSLADLGNAKAPNAGDADALKSYQDRLDEREYQLNGASVKLTKEIVSVWMPNPDRAEADRLRIKADGQYLKVVVEDDLGVEVELDQRSEGFQWLVSFFVVFFAEATDRHKNAILLLDEPGLHLHGLKQRDFRETISRLAEKNQTIYTTHSPFLVGPNELDIVRVVDMTDRAVGSKVHGNLSSGDPGALLPLQEALGYDLAQSLFSKTRNLVMEGLTDYWYVEAVAEMLRESGTANLNENIALVFANSAGKVVYYATILHAHKLKVAALLDSDAAGDQAAQQDTLVHTLGNKKIFRTKDYYDGKVKKPEIEDLLRETLIKVAHDDLGWDVGSTAAAHEARPIVNIFDSEIAGFSKYKLAKAFLHWARQKGASDLTESECQQWAELIGSLNKALK
ncbi:AAA ATPase-like protein [Kushneria sinocarnis]|uniref:AAA ATPase-like protein n=1 Tax=Kushneria sinocarnis TaxID=595502 RepID=A0A420WT24_9GAMM|nr:AAA family ATPase [Kushneria sinocarnis]RKQ95403.1 AAA ATPase-like protein [Kushneria sinocarnis]